MIDPGKLIEHLSFDIDLLEEKMKQSLEDHEAYWMYAFRRAELRMLLRRIRRGQFDTEEKEPPSAL